MPELRVTVPALSEAPARGERIVMVTAYDCPQGRQADAAGVDVVLVGDSLAMVVLGHEGTLALTMDVSDSSTKRRNGPVQSGERP